MDLVRGPWFLSHVKPWGGNITAAGPCMQGPAYSPGLNIRVARPQDLSKIVDASILTRFWIFNTTKCYMAT